ncbi:MAG: sucrose phosphorylase [Bacillota bacterium]
MKVKNEVMLITYPDSLGNDLKDLRYVMDEFLDDYISGIHILPFYPSSADRGFAPKTYEEVDSKFGNWKDLEKLSKKYYLMYDFMLNHISRSSKYFQDYLKNKNNSEYSDFFIKYSEFWENCEPTEKQVDKIYKRKPRAPYILAEFEDGTSEKIWCTFSEEQIDLDIRKEKTLEFVKETVKNLCNKGASVLRIDAFAYVTKKADTNCFFIEPETWDILNYIKDIANKYDTILLPEIHEHYSIQKKISNKGFWVYDFALPMLVLYTLYGKDNRPLINWLKKAPKKQFTTLDTHDGIGVVDVKDLMTDKQIGFTKDSLYENGANVKRVYNSEAYDNLDVYQLNCTYYSALGDNDKAYLLARAIQFFSPGIPQVYYVGLLAGKNDIDLLEETKVGRNINRHFYSIDEVEKNIKERKVVKDLLKLIKFRNDSLAFNGEMKINDTEQNILDVLWQNDDHFARLIADLDTFDFKIEYKAGDKLKNIKFD